MKKSLAFLLFWFVMGLANAQVTYAPTVANYTTVTDFTSCPVGETCTNYTTAMNQSGSFTVATALAPNLSNTNIAASVTSYSFSDGINTYSSANASDRIYRFTVTTDGAGNITSAQILLEKWLAGTSPHSSGDKFSYISVGSLSVNNGTCTTVGASLAGIADSCLAEGGGTGRSQASAPAASWVRITPSQPVSVPTLSEWAMIIMASLMAMFAFARMRKQG